MIESNSENPESLPKVIIDNLKESFELKKQIVGTEKILERKLGIIIEKISQQASANCPADLKSDKYQQELITELINGFITIYNQIINDVIHKKYKAVYKFEFNILGENKEFFLDKAWEQIFKIKYSQEYGGSFVRFFNVELAEEFFNLLEKEIKIILAENDRSNSEKEISKNIHDAIEYII